MITGLTVQQLKSLVFLKNTKPDQYDHIVSIAEMLVSQNAVSYTHLTLPTSDLV